MTVDVKVQNTEVKTPLDGPAERPRYLELIDAVKRYGSTEALRGANLVLYKSELMTLLGPSGSGKTTLLKLVAGFTDLDAGRIVLGGKDITEVRPGERGIGMVFQNYALFPHMTVEENVAYGMKMHGRAAHERRTRVKEMLELVGLPGYERRFPRELSGGQQQRVAFARALAFEPSLLLMDEPLGALDRELRDRMMVEIRRIHKEVGVTALYVTHDREEALTLSDRVAIMRDGSIEAIGPPAQLLTQPSTRFVASFFGGHALIPARVLETEVHDGTVSAQVDCLGQRPTISRVAGHIEAGDGAAVVLPATAISVTRDEAGQWIELEAHVVERVDLGDRIRISFDLTSNMDSAGSTLLRILADRLGSGAESVQLGQLVRLYADCSHLALVA